MQAKGERGLGWRPADGGDELVLLIFHSVLQEISTGLDHEGTP